MVNEPLGDYLKHSSVVTLYFGFFTTFFTITIVLMIRLDSLNYKVRVLVFGLEFLLNVPLL